MNVGQLNKRITYRMPATTADDGYGGTIPVPGAEVETWCSAKAMRMDETLRYGLPEGSVNYIFGFHYHQGKNILRGTDLTYKGKAFKANSVIEEDEEQNKVIVTATKQV